jgi:RNA-binding protein
VTDLTGKQRRHLRALANRLPATVRVGKDGVSASLVASVTAELAHRELVKVALNPNAEVTPAAVASQLPTATDSTWVQTLGRTIVLYRPAEPPEIALPA